eukprot:768553-Hanusia_phi.AAC.7
MLLVKTCKNTMKENVDHGVMMNGMMKMMEQRREEVMVLGDNNHMLEIESITREEWEWVFVLTLFYHSDQTTATDQQSLMNNLSSQLFAFAKKDVSLYSSPPSFSSYPPVPMWQSEYQAAVREHERSGVGGGSGEGESFLGLGEKEEDDDAFVSWLSQVNPATPLVLVGEPGCGKTFLLNR